MISKTKEQKLQYESRMKFLADQATNLESARNEGLEAGREAGREEGHEAGVQVGLLRGREEGVLIGKVIALQEILNLEVSLPEELALRSDQELHDMIGQLQRLLTEQD